MTRRRRAAAPVAVVLGAVAALAALLAPAAASASAPVDTTVPATASPVTTGRGSTTTSRAPARCEPVPPVAVQFTGAAVRVDGGGARFRIDDVRVGDPELEGTEVDVTYLRDARFLRAGTGYLVTVARDAESGAYLSKVRTLRGTDERCVAIDPIYTYRGDGSTIDTGVFSGLKGTRNKVLRAVLLPLGAAVGLLLALVIVKWTLILLGRGVRRLVRGPVRP